MVSVDWWKLVGVEMLDGLVIFDGFYVVVMGENVNGQCNVQGCVILIYFLFILGKGIVMVLVYCGFDCMGEVIEFNKEDGIIVQVCIVDLVFYDKVGEKVNV